MKIRIEKIHSENMFPGLIMGRGKDKEYDKSVINMKMMIGEDDPIINVSEIKWTQLKDSDGINVGYGSYGHISGAKICIAENDDRYSFGIIFNYLPELENLNEKITDIISSANWRENSFKWDIGDL